MPFIIKNPSKAIMERSRLRNNSPENRTRKNKTSYTKQRKKSLLKKSKKKCFVNLNEKDLDNKLFGRQQNYHCLIRS